MSKSTKNDIVFAIAAYSVCSGTLLLLNKLVLHFIPMPALVTLVQLVVAVLLVYSLSFMKVAKVDPLVKEKVIPYAYYTVAFTMGVYSNMRALANSNVETVIVFRALTPLAVSGLDYMFLGRDLPSTRSLLALCSIVAGAFIYVYGDNQFGVEGFYGYTWVCIYFCAICTEMTYGKKIVQDVSLSLSGSVLYTNLLAIIPFFTLFLTTNEAETLLYDHQVYNWPFLGCVTLFLSCIMGAGIGYSGWNCRHVVSATTYTMIGVMNKMLTVLLNILIWDKHASPISLCGLVICLVGGSLYRQAPMRGHNNLDVRA